MSSKAPAKDVAASVRARLLNYSRDNREDFNFVLTRYGIERLLYRLSRSEVADRFVLKGAMLFALWTDLKHRTTRDVDLLSTGDPDLEQLARSFRHICETTVEDDGLTFDAATVRATRIRDGEEYEGVRITLGGELAGARINLQVVVGFGDVITPAPIHTELPTLLDQPRPWLATYPRETAIAEKLHVIVTMGMANSRLKDFFDTDFLAAHFPFEGPTLTEAVRATFERRRTALPSDMPTAFTDLFTQDATKQAQWRAFLRKSGLAGDMDLVAVVARVKAFTWPVIQAARQEHECGTWLISGMWVLVPQ